MKKIISTNPGNNYEVVGEINASSEVEIISNVKLANEAKTAWGNLPVSIRIKYLEKALQLFKTKADDIGLLITKEIGTPITECLGEINWNWGYYEWFLNNIEKAISPEILFDDGQTQHQIWYEPTGSVAVITPWNLPFDLFIWGVIPNLLVGNTVIYKAAEECALSGKLYGEIMSQIGLPEGVFNIIHGDAEEGNILVHQNVDMVWFTGSSSVGKEIYALSGKKFIRSVLEMGGSNPVIIFDDAPITESLLNSILFERFAFCGQTCDADKRLIIHKSKYIEFINKFKPRVESLTLGLPENPQTRYGPLVSLKQLNLLVSQINDATKRGAKIITGGKMQAKLKGAYYLPTLITDVKTDMRIWKEEVFGPALPIVTFESESEAVKLANDTQYGLGSGIFTQDKDRMTRVAAQIKSGNVCVNGVSHFKPYIPFGGYKNSGMGREHGIGGFRELCQIKTVSANKRP